MDGLLVIDKPVGPTSHDIVQRVRRAIGERRIGHTGTLDPAASGVLPLVIGKATRLAWLLSAADKAYDAEVCLGFATDTYDHMGQALSSPSEGPLPSRADVEGAIDGFRGSFMQQPPAYSAKKLGGRRSYAVAREAARTNSPAPPPPAPVRVTVRGLDLITLEGMTLTLSVRCSAGFYVRSLAHDLGQRLATGGHLSALRRVRSGDVSLADAVALDVVERDPAAARGALIPLASMLQGVAAVTLTPEGVRRTQHGRDLVRDHLMTPTAPPREGTTGKYRLLDPDGQLLAIAEETSAGVLHPSIVLM